MTAVPSLSLASPDTSPTSPRGTNTMATNDAASSAGSSRSANQNDAGAPRGARGAIDATIADTDALMIRKHESDSAPRANTCRIPATDHQSMQAA